MQKKLHFEYRDCFSSQKNVWISIVSLHKKMWIHVDILKNEMYYTQIK